MKIFGKPSKPGWARLTGPILSFIRPICSSKRTVLLCVGFLLLVVVPLAVVLSSNKYTEKLIRHSSYLIRGRFIDPPDRVFIDIKFKNYQRLVDKRNEALKTRFLVKSEDDFVPATVTHNGKTVDIEMRLKGDYVVDHLTGDQWSFRVKVKGDGTLFGMKRFSLHRPSARYYFSEWVFHRVLAYEGLPAIRYEFINVTINGKNIGLYAIEETPGKYMIENSRLREGVVLQFDDTLFYENWAHQKESTLISAVSHLGAKATEIRAYEMTKIANDPVLLGQFRSGLELAGRVRAGKIKISDAFDIPQLAKYYALSDLMGAQHNTNYSNFKVYYNPVTSKLEPVGFDASNALTPVLSLTPERFKRWAEDERLDRYIEQHTFQLWEDEQFTREYLKQLERITQEDYIKKLLADLESPMRTARAHLANLNLAEEIKSQTEGYVRRCLLTNAQTIRQKINMIQGMYAYFSRKTEKGLILSIANIETIPLEVGSVTFRGKEIARPQVPLIIQPRKIYSPVEYARYPFIVLDNVAWNEEMLKEIRLQYKVPSTSIERDIEVFAWDFMDDDFFVSNVMHRLPNFREQPFLSVNDDDKAVVIKPGNWVVSQDVLIPEGWKVVAVSGARIDLKDGAKLISYSPFVIKGDSEDPVIFMSSDSTGQGIVLMKTSAPSFFDHVVFKNLSNPQSKGWELTGAVTFYEADVQITHCRFIHSRSEDSLNIIRSKFAVHDSLFEGSEGDAIDLDFAKGELRRLSIIRSANDAVDLSGTVATLAEIFVDGAGDKGISAGEASTVTIEDMTLKQCHIGIAGKDMSAVEFDRVGISDSQWGLVLYQKKSEYGPARIHGKNLKIDRVKKPYMVEEKSNLIIDRSRIRSDQKEARAFLEAL